MKKSIAIIGGGASALILAAELDTTKYNVSIFEKNASLGRKFLVAGSGGLNLTHSEDPEKFVLRYTPHDFISRAFFHFSNNHLIKWLNKLGIETYIGSSGRVFPKKGIKPVSVLNTITDQIKQNDVNLFLKHDWIGFAGNNTLLFDTPLGQQSVKSDIIIFCLGGASWPVTGSTGNWCEFFKSKNIRTTVFKASNCSFKINWPTSLINAIAGKPLKNIAITCGKTKHVGEIVITSFGVEGSGIYPLSPIIRDELSQYGKAKIVIDLKPHVSYEEAIRRISIPGSSLNYTSFIAKQLNLNRIHLALLKSYTTKQDFFNPNKLVYLLKNFELDITELGPLNDAISSVGGIQLNEITENFELKKMKDTYVLGEMLDYDAPTGGYLLQSCFSMGKFLADYLNSLP